jgi:hypothetical protein
MVILPLTQLENLSPSSQVDRNFPAKPPLSTAGGTQERPSLLMFAVKAFLVDCLIDIGVGSKPDYRNSRSVPNSIALLCVVVTYFSGRRPPFAINATSIGYVLERHMA